MLGDIRRTGMGIAFEGWSFCRLRAWRGQDRLTSSVAQLGHQMKAAALYKGMICRVSAGLGWHPTCQLADAENKIRFADGPSFANRCLDLKPSMNPSTAFAPIGRSLSI